MKPFLLDVSYAQIAVFDSRLANPFNEWLDAHVLQGFSWRDGSVSFSTVDVSGKVEVEVVRSTSNVEILAQADRVIVVPFSIPPHGEIEVATIASSEKLKLDPGDHELTFQHGRFTSERMWVRLTWRIVDGPVTPKIIRADQGLSPPLRLVMTARSA